MDSGGDSVASPDLSTALVCVGKDEAQLHSERKHERTRVEVHPHPHRRFASYLSQRDPRGASGTALVVRSPRPKSRSSYVRLGPLCEFSATRPIRLSNGSRPADRPKMMYRIC